MDSEQMRFENQADEKPVNIDELRVFQSTICPSIKVNKPNYLCEVMIQNFCKLRKRSVPSSPFWRKGISSNDEFLAELSKRYTVEVSACRQLLKKYPLSILIKYYKDSCMPGYKLLRKETRERIIAELEKRHAEYLARQPKQVILSPEDAKFTGVKNISKKNRISEL